MLFQGWYGVVRVVVAGVLGYAVLVVVLRASGKRTLSKMNAFDMVVTVALGSSFATVLLSKQVAIVEGVVAFTLLVVLQYVVAWASVRSEAVQRLVKSQPSLLYYRGEFQRAALRRERVTESEVRAALREQGYGSLEPHVPGALEHARSDARLGGAFAHALVRLGQLARQGAELVGDVGKDPER